MPVVIYNWAKNVFWSIHVIRYIAPQCQKCCQTMSATIISFLMRSILPIFFQDFEECFFPSLEQTSEWGRLVIQTTAVSEPQDCVKETTITLTNTVITFNLMIDWLIGVKCIISSISTFYRGEIFFIYS